MEIKGKKPFLLKAEIPKELASGLVEKTTLQRRSLYFDQTWSNLALENIIQGGPDLQLSKNSICTRKYGLNFKCPVITSPQ